MEMPRAVRDLTDDEVAELFEKLFLHYRKDQILEAEMMDFFEKQGVRIENKKDLHMLLSIAEDKLDWLEGGIGPGWTPSAYVRDRYDLEDIVRSLQEKYSGSQLD